MEARKRRAAILQKLVHYLTALGLLLKGLVKLEHPQGLWPVILYFLAASVWIAGITLLHDRLHSRERMLTASVYAIECVAIAIVAGLYFAEGKRALPWITALGSVGFAVAMVVYLRKTRGGNDHRTREV